MYYYSYSPVYNSPYPIPYNFQGPGSVDWRQTQWAHTPIHPAPYPTHHFISPNYHYYGAPGSYVPGVGQGGAHPAQSNPRAEKIQRHNHIPAQSQATNADSFSRQVPGALAERKELDRHIPKGDSRDIWKETPLRYLGYTNEIGEGWVEVLKDKLGPKKAATLHKASYDVAKLYALADSLTSGFRTYRNTEGQPQELRLIKSISEAGYAGIFQYIASVTVPPLVIKFVRHGLEKMLPTLTKAAPKHAKLISLVPALVSTAVIPLIVKPIDRMAHKILDMTYVPLSQGIIRHAEKKYQDRY